MSIDEEFENKMLDVSLLSVLESRNECLNKSEVWAILKETCIALKPIEFDVINKRINLNISCLLIDTSGNIKVDFEQYDNKNGSIENGRDRNCLIHSLGEIFKYILENYSDVKSSDELFQFIDKILLSSSNDQYTIHNIELYSDRQLNGSSIDLLYNEDLNSKRSEDLSSAFQDSFFSTEFSVNSDDESDTDQSICITKDYDTFSTVSDGKSFDNSEESKYFVCLNQLWSHCLDPIFQSDQECLVFIYVILKEMSNILLNEDNFKKCLCISRENVFLNPLGQMLLNFSASVCENCLQNNGSTKYHDIKYINTVGTMLYEIIESDHRISLSDQILLLLQRMQNSSNMIINEILYFCKTNTSFQAGKCRVVLKWLFERWNYWFNIHLKYLSNLKHKYLCEISTKNPIKNLKPTCVKEPTTVQELFHRHPSWLNDLKFTTKLSKPSTLDGQAFVSNNFSSAFRPYNNNIVCSLPPPLPNTARIKTTTHFRPLVFTSESSSVYRSQDIMFSPLDVSAKYSNFLQSKAKIPSTAILSSSKNWRSMNHLYVNDTNDYGKSQETPTSSFRQNNSRAKSNSKSTLAANCSSKVNLIIDIIQDVLEKSFQHNSSEVADRHLLGIADFALSLGRTSKSVFLGAIRQRYDHIIWTEESLEELYDVISTKDICTSFDDNKTTERVSEDIDYCKPFVSSTVLQKEPRNSKESRNKNFSSRSSSSASKKSENFDDIERMCAAAASIDRKQSIESIKVKSPEYLNVQKIVISKHSTNIDESSDISDYNRKKPAPVLPNKLRSAFSFLSPEDTAFYQQIYPITLLCFQSTMTYVNRRISISNDQLVNSTKIQELLICFQEKNRTIRFKFKELSKTIDLISKCEDSNKNERKIRKQFLTDHNELQLCIESLILEEMKLENTIVEYHSLRLETILGEIQSNRVKQPIVFSQDEKNLQNLKFIHPMSLILCLFSQGAVSSGLMYEFFLVYREFYKPYDFIEGLKSTFSTIESKLKDRLIWIGKARFRLLYIILCWIDGFYDIDISPQILSLIKDLTRTTLVPFIKNVEELIETTIMNAKGSKTALSLQFTALHRKVNLTSDIIHNVDIQKMISGIDKTEKDKEKLYLRSSLHFFRGNSLGNQDTFSILNISPKDLAICLTLIQQLYFNRIHPCHLLLYLRSLSGNDESILNSIDNDRFPVRQTLVDNPIHCEIRALLLLSGQITHWATSEILLTTDPKLQAKIVKKLVLTCSWCKDLNNFATMTSIIEALTTEKLKWAPFWTHVSSKIKRTLDDIISAKSKLFNSTLNYPDGHDSSSNALFSGVAFLPCLHAILVHLKMSSFGKCMTIDGCLKWNKLRKISKILDQIRLYKQFRYISKDTVINELRTKLKLRIEHLTSISLDILQSHNMLTQTS